MRDEINAKATEIFLICLIICLVCLVMLLVVVMLLAKQISATLVKTCDLSGLMVSNIGGDLFQGVDLEVSLVVEMVVLPMLAAVG